MAGYIPELSGYSGQGAFRYWCQKVLPLVYDDSLSYYELLNKIVVYLNNTIEDVAKAEGNIDSLLTAYTSLKNDVDHYFDTLDVQEQINTKLDNMAETGELSDLLEPFIPVLVTSWLDEHVTPTSPIVDNSLSISGAAADAKVTGDELAKTVMSSKKYITHSNLRGYTDADDFENNRIFLIGADVEEDDIINLPNYGQLGYVLTLTAHETDSSAGLQLYYSATKSFVRRKRLSVWSDWREYANSNDVINLVSDNMANALKYQVFYQSDYATLADFPVNTSHIVNTTFADAPETASYGALITMRFSPYNKLQVFFAQTGTQGIYYRTVNFEGGTNVSTAWRNLFSIENNLNASGITIEHSNLHGFTSLDELEGNKIYCLSSDLLDTDIENMPYSGQLAYVITFQAINDYNQNGVQMYISNSKTYTRRKRLNVWSDWVEYANYNDVFNSINEISEYMYSNIGNMARSFVNWGSGSGTVTEVSPVDLPNRNITKAYRITVTTAPYSVRTPAIRIIKNATYTMKCWAKGNGSIRLNCEGKFLKDQTVSPEWEEYSFTFINTLDSFNGYIYFANATDDSEIEIAGLSFKVADEPLLPLYNEVILKGDWEYGTLGTSQGSPISDNTRIRSRIFMSFPDVADDKIIITIPQGYGINYRIYNEDETFSNSVSTITYAENNDVEKYMNVEKDKKYKFVVFPYNSETINLVDFSKTTIKIKYNTLENKPTIKILSIGNSHTRDAVRYVQHILAKNGYRAELGHYYWGGSTLRQQYEGLDYNINPDTTVIPSTDPDMASDNFPKEKAWYRCYNDFGTYTSDNGTGYNRMTLVNAVYDKPWDIVIFQQQTDDSGLYESFFSNEFNFNAFIKLIDGEIENENIKIGIMAVHTRASTYPWTLYSPAILEELIQETIPKVAKNMSQCDYIVNTGLAIKYSRENEYLRLIGNDMCQDDGVHLDYYIPQYIASMTYAMTICGDSIADVYSVPESFSEDKEYLAYLGIRYAKYATLNVDNLLEFNDNKIYNEYPTQTVIGNPLSISNFVHNVPLKNLIIKNLDMSVIGEGTPSLSNIYQFIPKTSAELNINGETNNITFRNALYDGEYDVITGISSDSMHFIEFDGTEDWSIVYNGEDEFPAFLYHVNDKRIAKGNAVANSGIFNILPSLTSITGSTPDVGGRVYVSSANNVIVMCRFSNLFTNLEEFTDYLANLKTLGHPLQVVYTLKNKQYYIEEKLDIETDNLLQFSTANNEMQITYCVDTQIAGYKCLAVGDSICAGKRNNGFGFIGYFGLDLTNISVGGACITNVKIDPQAPNTEKLCIYKQFENYANDLSNYDYYPDILIADGGINDYGSSTQSDLGTFNNIPVKTEAEANLLDKSTISGALEYLFYLWIKNYPKAQRYFVLTHKTYFTTISRYAPTTDNTYEYNQYDMNELIKEICKAYGVKIIDVYNESELNTIFTQYVSPINYEAETNTTIDKCNITNTYFADKDGVHPLDLGYREAYVPLVREALKTATKKNILDDYMYFEYDGSEDENWASATISGITGCRFVIRDNSYPFYEDYGLATQGTPYEQLNLIKSNQYPEGTHDTPPTSGFETIVLRYSPAQRGFQLFSSSFTTLADFKEYLSVHPLKVIVKKPVYTV